MDVIAFVFALVALGLAAGAKQEVSKLRAEVEELKQSPLTPPQ